MNEENIQKKRSCPLRSEGEECREDCCEWFVRSDSLMSGRGLCAVTLSGISTILLHEISKKI